MLQRLDSHSWDQLHSFQRCSPSAGIPLATLAAGQHEAPLDSSNAFFASLHAASMPWRIPSKSKVPPACRSTGAGKLKFNRRRFFGKFKLHAGESISNLQLDAPTFSNLNSKPEITIIGT